MWRKDPPWKLAVPPYEDEDPQYWKKVSRSNWIVRGTIVSLSILANTITTSVTREIIVVPILMILGVFVWWFPTYMAEKTLWNNLRHDPTWDEMKMFFLPWIATGICWVVLYLTYWRYYYPQ